jgi:pyruvate dehydrogenase E2 component (dihydrolipoamide acetyltransferase)
MIKEFRLPDLGEGLTESEILRWKVAVGDTVELNQVIAEVETAKAVVELPSPFAGKIAALHEQPGTVVEVGKPIVSFEVADDVPPAPVQPAVPEVPAAEHAAAPGTSAEAPSAEAKPTEPKPAEAQSADVKQPAKREPNLVGYGAFVEEPGPPVRRVRHLAGLAAEGIATEAEARPPSSVSGPATAAGAPMAPEAATTPAPPDEAEPVAPETTRPRSTPPVRKFARDLGVDLASVSGTGPQGVITREDVQAYVDGAGGKVGGGAEAAKGAEARDRTPREERIPIRGVRKHTAAAVVSSAFGAPHVTEFLTVDVTAAMELLARLKASKSFAGHKLTPLTLVAKALLIALRRNPTLNSRWDEQAQEIVQFNYVNLGIAAATPRGLTVPNIKDAETMPLLELSDALSDLTQAARAGKTTPAELAGGTISITNIGVFGIDAGTPILNPGEAAILAVGAVRRMPWEFEGEVALRQVMTLSLSFDHRLVDGEQGSRFLADVGQIMSDPAMVLAMV